MAKEQKRGNREARKPKQVKATITQPINPFANAGKGASNTSGGKAKG